MKSALLAFSCVVLSFLSLPAYPSLGQETKDPSAIAQHASRSVVCVVPRDSTGRDIGKASGFVAAAGGLIVTNYHVIEGASQAEVKFPDGTAYAVEGVLASDPDRDLVVLKLATIRRDFTPLPLGKSEAVAAGEHVIAIGSALASAESGGAEGAATAEGVVSAIRPLEARDMSILETSVRIAQGTTGGALLNTKGEVVGIPSYALVGGDNVSVAIPVKYAVPLVADGPVTPLASAATAGSDRRVNAAQLQNRSPEELLGSAKTLCVSLGAGDPVLKTELSAKLLKWGKLRLVSSPEVSDLVLEVVQTGQMKLGKGVSNQATAVLTHRPSGTQLWSSTQGGALAFTGWRSAWVAGALAKQFIAFYEARAQAPSPAD